MRKRQRKGQRLNPFSDTTTCILHHLRCERSRWIGALAVVAIAVLVAQVWALVPYWPAGANFSPVLWPTNDGDGELDFGDWQPYWSSEANKDEKVQDPSNGGTSPQNYVNVSSGCTDQTYPSSFWYYDSTNEVLMYRWRVEQIAHTYATGPNAGTFSDTDPWKSALWTVLIDIDGDGYREFALHVDGSSGTAGNEVDRMYVIYSDTPYQSIDWVNDPAICLVSENPTAFVDSGTERILNFQNTATPTINWPNGLNETVWDYGTTRAVLVDHGTCIEYFIDYQIPLAMLNDSTNGCGQPTVTEDTPIAMTWATANSLNNPFQKDVVLNGETYTADPDEPGPFGPPITPGGGTIEQPVIQAVTASGCGPAALRAEVTDAAQIVNGEVEDTITSVEFYYYEDTNANGEDDDGNSWTLAGTGISSSLGIWTTTWDTTSLRQGQYLIGILAVDEPLLPPPGEQTIHATRSWETPAEAAARGPGNYANPSPEPGIVVATFINTCGTAPSVTKTASSSMVAPPDPPVQFTITVSASEADPLTVDGINDLLPAGWSFVSTDGGSLGAPTTAPFLGATGTIIWTWVPGVVIPAGESRTLIFTAQYPPVAGAYNNVASAVTSEGNLESNPLQVAVGLPRLTIAKEADAYSVIVGATVTYTITYSNDSPVTATNTVITDALPDGLTFVSATNGGVHDGETPGTITWNIGTLGAGEGPYTVGFTATVTDPYPATAEIPLVNTANIDSDQTSPASDDATVHIFAPLAIQKDANLTQVSPGLPLPVSQVTYTISYANSGPNAITNIVITDPVPAGFAFVSASAPGVHDGGNPGTVTWNLGSLAPGATGTVTMALDAVSPVANPTRNTATISGDSVPSASDWFDVGVTQSGCTVITYYFHDATIDPGTGTEERTATTTAGTDPGVFVSSPVTLVRQDFLYFYQDPTSTAAALDSTSTTVTYWAKKTQGNPTVHLTLYDYDPATNSRALIGAGTGSAGGNVSQESITWTAPWTYTLAQGHRLEWVFGVSGTNSSQIDFHFDGATWNSRSGVCASNVTPVLDKEVDRLSASAGNALQYTIKYANSGAASMTGTTLVDTLPNGVTFLSSAPAAPTCTPSGRTITCNLGTVAGGGTGTVTINVTIDSPLPGDVVTLKNTATLSSALTETIEDSATTVVARPALVIDKSVSDTLIYPGEAVTYTLAVTNVGSANANAISGTDDFPEATFFTTIGSCVTDMSLAPTTTTTTCTTTGTPPASLSFTADALGPGETIIYTFQMQANSNGLPSGLTDRDNSAIVGGTGITAVTSNTVRVIISTNPNLGLTKSSLPATGPLSPGDTVTYTLVVSSTGLGNALNVVVTDPIPADSSYVLGSMTYDGVGQTEGMDADTGYFDGVSNRVVFAIGTLPQGASHTMTFQVNVDSPLPNGTTAIDNTGTATASNTGSKQASANLTAAAAPVLTLSKVAPDTLAYPLTTLAARAQNATVISVSDASLISVNDYVEVNGTAARVTAINTSGTPHTLTLDTAVSANNGSPVNPVIPYTLRYRNTGSANATNTVVTDPLPTGTRFVAADSGGIHDGGSPGSVTWDLGTVAPGAGGSLKFWALPSAPGTYTNTGTIDSDETSPLNDSSTTELGILQPTKRTTTPHVTNSQAGGDPVTWIVTVVNSSANTAVNLSVTDTMENGFSYASTTSTSGGTRTSTVNPSAGDNPATWCCWNLGASATLTIEFVANMDDRVGPGTYQNDLSALSTNVSSLEFDEVSTTDEDVTVDQWIGPNHVVVSWIEAYQENGSVTVEWETDAEHRTVGFHLKRRDEATGEYEAVHDGLLEALIASPQGGVYRVEDTAAPLGIPLSYLLVEIENDGTERSYGPFTLEVGVGKTDLASPSRAPRRFSRRPHSLRRPPQETERVARRGFRRDPVEGLKIAVPDRGLYRVTASDIAEVLGLGLQEASYLIGSKRLDLRVGGVSVPWLADVHGGTPALLFYGEGTDSIYSRDRTYQLVPGRGKPMESVPSGVGTTRRTRRRGTPATTSAPPGQSSIETIRIEEDRVPLLVVPMDENADFWFWDSVVAGQPGKSFELDVVGMVPGGPASLTLHVKGMADLGAGTHHFRARVNGQDVGEGRFRGFEYRPFTFALDPFVLQEGRNTVELVGIPEPDVPYSGFFLDAFDVDYERAYTAHEHQILAHNQDHTLMTFSGFAEPDVLLLDVSDPENTKLVRGAGAEWNPSGYYQVTFSPSSPDARYLAVTPTGIRQPASIEVDHPSSLTDTRNAADYLLVTTAELAPVAERLASHRAGQGLETMVIDIDNIMDEFNHGQFDPHIIRAFLTHAHQNWQVRPRYLLLIGEGTVDYKDNWGLGNNLLPPLMVAGHAGLYASDNRLGDITGEDGIPEVAVGRIPVETPDQLTVYIDKITEYDLAEDDGWTKEILLAADNPDETGNYPADSEVLVQLLPGGYQPNRVYLSDMTAAEAFQVLLTNWNRGVSLVTYLGHAGLTQLATEGLLRTSDLPELTNAERLPVVAVMGCYLGNFYLPGYPSLAEDLVLHTEGGAAAVWAPAALSYNPQRRLLGEAFLRAAFSQNAGLLGDLVIDSLNATANKLGNVHRELLDSQVLLGDPALRLKGIGGP